MLNKNMDEQDQLTLINLIISDSSIFTRVKPILKPEFFDKKYQKTITYLHDFSNTYNTLPTLEQLNNESRISYSLINGVSTNSNLQKSILDLTEQFCKKRALELAIEESYNRIAKGDTTSIEKIIKDAQSLSIKKDLGMNFWDNAKDWLHKLDVEMGVLSSGMKSIDDMLNGGFSWGQLNYVVAPSGGGKSLMMANLALNWSLMGFNVLYFTLELDKELVGKRLLAMQQDIAYKLISHNIDTCADKLSFYKKNNNPGVLQIIELPRAATPNDIVSCIQNFETETNIIPNILCVDYAGIMSPSDRRVDVNSIHLRDKAIAEELREIARERTHNDKKTMVISAAQITKDTASEMEFTQSDVAGGSTLVHTCDNLFSVRTNDAMRQRGEYELKFIKCRNAGATDKKLKLKFNVDTLKISDMEETQATSPTFNNNNNVMGALATLQKLASN